MGQAISTGDSAESTPTADSGRVLSTVMPKCGGQRFGQLATLGTDECVEGLSIALRDNDATIVTEAVKGLGGIGSEPAQTALMSELDRTERKLASMRTRWEPWKVGGPAKSTR